MAITSLNTLNDDHGMQGQHLAIWQVLQSVINAKGVDTNAVDQEVKAALDEVEQNKFDPARVNALVVKLDALTLPSPITMSPAPQVGVMNYAVKALPDLNLHSAHVPATPADRALMAFGSAPTLDTAGDPASLQDYQRLLTAERDALLDMVQGKFRQFIADFMPAAQPLSDAMAWLGNALHARNTGVPVHVEAQIHERNRARIHKETSRQIATAKASWAGKGFTLPPGALVGMVQDLRRDQLEQLSTSSRELVIYITEKHIENARFAVEQLMSQRVQAINAALEYMKALILSPQQAGDWLTAMIDNRTKVAQAKADIYRTSAGVATDVFKVQTDSDVGKFKTLADVSLEDARQSNSAQTERFRAVLSQEQFAFESALEQFKARTGSDLEAYKVATSAMLGYFDAQTKAAALKADVIGKTTDTAMKLEELQYTQQNQVARMRVDAAMERLKTYAQQASAALNNLQLSASSGTSYNISARSEEA